MRRRLRDPVPFFETEQDVTAFLQIDVAQAGREWSKLPDLLLRKSHTDLFKDSNGFSGHVSLTRRREIEQYRY